MLNKKKNKTGCFLILKHFNSKKFNKIIDESTTFHKYYMRTIVMNQNRNVALFVEFSNSGSPRSLQLLPPILLMELPIQWGNSMNPVNYGSNVCVPAWQVGFSRHWMERINATPVIVFTVDWDCTMVSRNLPEYDQSFQGLDRYY